MSSRISTSLVSFGVVASSKGSAHSRAGYCSSTQSPVSVHFGATRQVRRDGSLFAGLHNLRQLQDALRNQAASLGVSKLSLCDAKKFLCQLGFKRHGENFFGPHGMQVHIDRGVSHNHGDHLDITQKGTKIKVQIDPEVRFE